MRKVNPQNKGGEQLQRLMNLTRSDVMLDSPKPGENDENFETQYIFP